jgi:hypothetical protein
MVITRSPSRAPASSSTDDQRKPAVQHPRKASPPKGLPPCFPGKSGTRNGRITRYVQHCEPGCRNSQAPLGRARSARFAARVRRREGRVRDDGDVSWVPLGTLIVWKSPLGASGHVSEAPFAGRGRCAPGPAKRASPGAARSTDEHRWIHAQRLKGHPQDVRVHRSLARREVVWTPLPGGQLPTQSRPIPGLYGGGSEESAGPVRLPPHTSRSDRSSSRSPHAGSGIRTSRSPRRDRRRTTRLGPRRVRRHSSAESHSIPASAGPFASICASRLSLPRTGRP